MEFNEAMDNLRNILESDPVPDPGERYWREFAGRVAARLETDASRTAGMQSAGVPRAAAGFLPVAAAAALFLFALALPRMGVVRRDSTPEGIRSAVLSEAETTARLAGVGDGEGLIMILDRTAGEKAGMAAAAFRRGDIDSLVPIVRSWEKIVRTGMIGSLAKVGRNDEDVGAFAGKILESAAAADSQWRAMAAAIDDQEAGEVLLTAIDTAEDLVSALGNRLE